MDVKDLVVTYEGRKFLMELLIEAGTFKQNPPEHSEFYEGRRSIGLEIYDKILAIDIEFYTMMYREHKEREQHERARR